MSNSEITPIRKQYLDIKSQYPDAILFFRLGDFYETFDQDAEITSRELDIVLTSRNVAKNRRIPMAGIPYHAVDNYLSRLIQKGYHVAICEQVGEQPQKGIFPREVVRVVTPGTIIEPELLNGDQNNYLASIVFSDNKAGIAITDITTGEFLVTEISGADLTNSIRDELLRLKPAEVVIDESVKFPNHLNAHITKLPAWKFEHRICEETLKTHFKVDSLDGFGLRGFTQAVIAAGVILQYLQDTQKQSLKLLNDLSTYQLNEYMTLDSATLRNLELTETIRKGETKGSLLKVLDHTITPMGERLIHQWITKPLLDLQKIKNRQENVRYLFENGMLRKEIQQSLKTLGDLERLTNRVIAGHAQPRDLVAIRDFLSRLPEIRQLFKNTIPESLEEIISRIHDCSPEFNLLRDSISENAPATLQKTGIIKKGYSPELDNVINSSKSARTWIANLEKSEKERTGIKTLKVGYNKVFGYYIEISRGSADSAPPEYIRKQTLVNAERFITPEMKEYEALVLNAEEEIKEIENRIFTQVCAQLAQSSKKLIETARNLAILDVITSFAESAALNGYICPDVTEGSELEIQNGRHPVVEETLSNQRFVPNDSTFEEGEIVRIITGPNMSGKSTFLRQVALIALMAQIGSFVPAEKARIGLVDRIFTRIGAQDEIHAGQSTFMVEMVETANILHHATNKSLLILDEIGRGTSTYDGVSIAWAVIEYIHNHPKIRSRTLFATHYHELTQLSEMLPGVRNYNVAVSESEARVVFLHKIIAGSADRSYGIHVGQISGLPGPVIQRATEILSQLELTSGSAADLKNSATQQMALFPETNPLIKELEKLDLNSLSPIEALNKLYEWQKKYTKV